MFYRATKLSTGSGLGMYIVKETLEKLEGTITLKSKENKVKVYNTTSKSK
jgi:signal transduction histidine kinase